MSRGTRPQTWNAVAGMAAAIVCLLATAHGDGLEVAIGFGGTWRVGSWTPVVVSSTSGALAEGDQVRVWADDADGQSVGSPEAKVIRGPDGNAVARTRVRVGRPGGLLRIETIASDGAATSIIAPLSAEGAVASTDEMTIVYGPLPAAGRAIRLLDRERGTTTRVVAGSVHREEAATALDLDAADTIVVCGSVVGDMPPPVIAAIDDWVTGGGRLVMLSGGSAVALSNAGGTAAAWLPGRVDRMVPLRRLGAVESYARSRGLDEHVGAAGLSVPTFTDPIRGAVDAAATDGGSVPLVVRRARGFGTVTWVGFDIDAASLRDWPGWETLLLAALGGRAAAQGDVADVEHTGTVDLDGQLRTAIDSFSSAGGSRPMRPVPFEVIALVGLLLVISLYPGDWMLVSRIGRPWLAWLTLPVIAAVFTAVAMGLKAHWGGDGASAARRIDVVDVDAESGLARGRSWTAFLSPENAILDLSSKPGHAWSGTDDDASRMAVTWWASAGHGFGGMDAAVPHPSLAAADYHYAESLASLEAVPIAAVSTRLFTAEWTMPSPVKPVTATLVATDQATLSGAVAHHLPWPLERCQLLHGGWIYDLGRLEPGATYDVAAGRGPRSLVSALTRRSASKAGDQAARWNAASLEADRILEVAAFHAAVGGAGFTGLDAGRLARLDLTPLLWVDRAMLVGLVTDPSAAARWAIRVDGDASRHEPQAVGPTLCRIVIPLGAEAIP